MRCVRFGHMLYKNKTALNKDLECVKYRVNKESKIGEDEEWKKE